MKPRRLLLLTYHFPPSGAVAVYRMIGLAQHLPRFGWRPIVVAPPGLPWEPIDQGLLEHVPAETEVVRVPMAGGLAGKMARRLSPVGHWVPRAYRHCTRIVREQKPEAVLTSSPPGCIHQLGLLLQSRFGLPWMACFRDPWISGHLDLQPSFAAWRDRWLEKQVVRRADVVIANTPMMREKLREAYPERAGRVVTITNGFDPDRFPRGLHVPPAGDTVSLLHAGELYTGRDPRPLLAALQELQGEQRSGPRLRVEFVGRTTEKLFDWDSELRQRGLRDTVHVEGHVPYQQALERMARADMLLLIQRPGYRITVPAKLYEYFGTGRPILALADLDGDIAWALRTSGVLHRIAPPTDVPLIKQALRELSQDVHRGMPVVSDEAALHAFTRQRMAQQFAEVLDRLVPANAWASHA